MAPTKSASDPDPGIAIEDAVAACQLAGNGLPPGAKPVRSALKSEASLIGMAYLNYIYQNDIANRHFCQSMLLMAAQIPPGADNRYVALFTPEGAAATLAALADIQLAFDHAIARTDMGKEKVRAAVERVRGIVG